MVTFDSTDFDSAPDESGVAHDGAGDNVSGVELGYPRSSTNPLSDGLVAWWPLAEESGATAYDLAGSNNGSATGTTTGNVGVMGMPCRSFDGTDDYISLSSISDIEDNTISLWMNSNDVSSVGTCIALLANNNQRIRTNSGNVEYAVRSNGSTTTITKSASNNVWYHLVGVHKSDDTMQFYVNGELAGETTKADSSAGGSDRIGRANADSRFFNGEIADVRIYNRSFSASEVQTLYEMGQPSAVEQATVNPDAVSNSGVARYALDGDATDSWGSNDGTVSGATSGASGVGGTTCYSFDGTDDYIDFSGLGWGDTPLTISLWQYADSWSTGTGYGGEDQLVFFGDGSPQFELFQDDGSFTWRYWDGSSAYGIAGAEQPPVGQWNHIVATFSTAGTWELYYNGVQVATATDDVSPNISGTGNQIGRTPSGNRYYSGDIDEVRIYDRALTQAEVWSLYNIGRNGNWMTVNE